MCVVMMLSYCRKIMVLQMCVLFVIKRTDIITHKVSLLFLIWTVLGSFQESTVLALLDTMLLIVSALSLLLATTSALGSPEVNRRWALQSATAGLLAPTIMLGIQPSGAGESTLSVPNGKSILVLGANGKTGRECVAAAIAARRPCIATTRNGAFEWHGDSNMLTIAQVDVTSKDSIESAIASSKNLGAVIFAASASASGSTPFPVDRDGVINAAKCCIAAGVPRLVVVSSGTVTRPDSAVYKLLNTIGHGIMEAKIQGEDIARELYADPSVLKQKLGYTIIRPGGLTTGESLGPAALELNQGDSKSGRLSRADVAGLCINCLDSSDTFDTTFECYETLTGKPVESVGLSVPIF
jgi:uncharacterized protein YbjT (DUF2867 family)